MCYILAGTLALYTLPMGLGEVKLFSWFPDLIFDEDGRAVVGVGFRSGGGEIDHKMEEKLITNGGEIGRNFGHCTLPVGLRWARNGGKIVYFGVQKHKLDQRGELHKDELCLDCCVNLNSYVITTEVHYTTGQAYSPFSLSLFSPFSLIFSLLSFSLLYSFSISLIYISLLKKYYVERVVE